MATQKNIEKLYKEYEDAWKAYREARLREDKMYRELVKAWHVYEDIEKARYEAKAKVKNAQTKYENEWKKYIEAWQAYEDAEKTYLNAKKGYEKTGRIKEKLCPNIVNVTKQRG